jgi:hypothetical protein
MERLPIEIIKYIISYDRRFVIKKGKLIEINRIDKNDKRYNMLLNIEKKQYDTYDNSSYVYIKVNSRKDFYIMYCDYKFEILTFWCDDRGNMDIHNVQCIENM